MTIRMKMKVCIERKRKVNRVVKEEEVEMKIVKDECNYKEDLF